MNTPWTQGPLLSDAEGFVFKDDALGTQVANCGGAAYIHPTERVANARLYADAPLLYAALDQMTSVAAGLVVLGRNADPTEHSTADFIDREYPSIRKAMALLAHARGEV